MKKKVFSFINITGLAIGIAFTLLIGSYVWQELQVNSELRNIDNQYIVLSKWKDPNMGPETKLDRRIVAGVEVRVPCFGS